MADSADLPADAHAVDPVDAPDAAALGDRLLAAAAEVFAERGYEKAGVAEIARRAGVTTGAIYSRYRGKAELLVEAIDPHAHDELEALFSDHHFEGRMEDILLTAGTHLVKREGGGGAAQASLLLEAFVAARRHPDVAKVLRSRVLERRDRLTTIVETAKSEGGIAADIDTESLVAFCHALAFGFLLFDATDLPLPTPGPWEHLITELLAALGRSGSADLAPPSATEAPRGNRP